MVGRLDGLNVAVTGASSGIGRAIALRSASEGANVTAMGRSADSLASLTAELGAGHRVVQGDIRSRKDLETFFAVASTMGTIGALVANAGVSTSTPFDSITDDEFDSVIDTNVKGTFQTVQAALPFLANPSSVVLVSSALGHLGLPGLVTYGASKAAIRSMARTMSAELVGRGVRVNVLSPGPTETPIFERMGLPPELVGPPDSPLLADVPIGRFADVDEIAAAALFLMSSESAYMLGSELVIDGGHSQL